MADGLTLVKDRIINFGRKPADQFQAHPLNWRKHPQRQRAAVEASLRELGWVGVVIENVQTGNLIDGHERVWQALKAGGDVPYIQVDLTPEEEALALATFDAITNMAETDAAKLDELLRDVSTGEAALMELIAETREAAGPVRNAPPDYSELDIDMWADLPMPEGVPDSLWPTDNEWGIPLLEITRQANAFDLPIETWGAKGRNLKAGTYHFYTDDGRFAKVWERPDMVVQAGCVNVVEPNFSVYDQVPRAVALWATFRKRWLSRYWQSCGLRVFVDLNVARPYDDLNMIGVPKGWQAYATRGYSDRIDGLQAEYDIARTHADGNSVYFLVIGGGDKAKAWCLANGAVWTPDDINRANGRYLGTLEGGDA